MRLRSSSLETSGKSFNARVFAALKRNRATVLAAGAATPVLGPESLIDPSFNDATKWTAGTGWQVTGGNAVATSVAMSVNIIPHSSGYTPTVAGETYFVEYVVPAATAGSYVVIIWNGSTNVTQDTVRTSAGTYTFSYVATNAQCRPYISAQSANTSLVVSSLSQKRLTTYTYGNPPTRNYFDSAGTDILDSVTQVDQPVGLVLDAAGVVGPELAGLSTPWQSYGTGISLVGGQMVFTASPAGQFAMRGTPLTANKTYELEITIPAISEGRLQMLVSGGAGTVSITTPGTYRGIYKATGVDGPYLLVASGTVTAVVTVASCRELTATQATQATTGSKPTLRRGLVNQLLYSQWGGGGNAPTGWTAFGGGGVEGALLPSGMRQRVFTSTASQDSIYQTIALAANTTYTFALSVDANPGNFINGALVGYSTIPAGTSFTVASSTAVASVGSTILVTIVVGATAGNMLLRVGPGSQTVTTGSVTLSAPALFQGTVTAQQILAAGGIPLTTTAPASSSLGNYWWQFDPAAPGDFFGTGITTGNEGWVCAGVTFTGAASANETIAGSGASSPTAKGIWLARVGSATENTVGLYAGNGTLRHIALKDNVAVRNIPRVIDGGWNATTCFVAVDGVESSTARSGDMTPPASSMQVGAVGGLAPLSGAMPVQVICPTLPPPADRALIRAWVAKQQGQTL